MSYPPATKFHLAKLGSFFLTLQCESAFVQRSSMFTGLIDGCRSHGWLTTLSSTKRDETSRPLFFALVGHEGDQGRANDRHAQYVCVEIRASFLNNSHPHPGPSSNLRIVELLVQARKNAGITQVELGKRPGRRQTFVSEFELGERRLDVAEFVAVSRVIGVDPHGIIQTAEGEERGAARH